MKAVLSTKVCAWRKGRKLYKNLAMIVLRYLPGKSIQKRIAEIDTMCKKLDFNECLYVANCAGNWYEKEIVQKDWFGTPTLMQFENYEFFCPEKIDEYLSAIYGDWRKLPPVEKQISHHDYLYLDLNTSYIEKLS